MENGYKLVNGHSNGHHEENENEAEKRLSEQVYKEFNLISQFLTPDALTNTYYNYEMIESIAKWLLAKTEIRPLVAIICGSGLGGIGEIVENKHVIPYSHIPEFPKVTINGHVGNLIFGTMGSTPVVCMQGRFHSYEGYTLAVCCMPVKLFKLLGCRMMLATNAAGSLNPAYEPGDLMVIKDHFSVPMLTMQHPLMGPNDPRFGNRFVPANKIYDRELRRAFLDAASRLNVRVHEGVYGVIGGPAYESVTDARFLQNQGCDCSGMSTSHESMVASYCGMKVLAFSIITNRIVTEFDADEIVDHNEVVAVANKKALEAEKLVSYFISKVLNESNLLD